MTSKQLKASLTLAGVNVNESIIRRTFNYRGVRGSVDAHLQLAKDHIDNPEGNG